MEVPSQRALVFGDSIVETDSERILVTHGQAVLQAGRRELERGLTREPWQPGDTGLSV